VTTGSSSSLLGQRNSAADRAGSDAIARSREITLPGNSLRFSREACSSTVRRDGNSVAYIRFTDTSRLDEGDFRISEGANIR
jgi:hypothetical protein